MLRLVGASDPANSARASVQLAVRVPQAPKGGAMDRFVNHQNLESLRGLASIEPGCLTHPAIAAKLRLSLGGIG